MENIKTHLDSIKPKLSVVIGANNAQATISECLTVVRNQLNGQGVEIIVVDNSTDGTAEIVSNQFPDVKLIRSPESNFIPELWEIGISQGTSDIVAITTAHFVPGKNWIAGILKTHEKSYVGIGGAIENDEIGGLIEWAIYFCRYSSFMLPFPEASVKDFAGDNASYKRWALDRCKHVRDNGFWEPFVHAELLKNGQELLLTPTIVVYHKKSFSLLGFMKQRFWHGRQFGGTRASGLNSIWRLIYILLSPLIPIMYLSRITRRILVKKRHLGKYLLSLPILVLFLLSWATGELSGYLWRSESKKW